MPARTTRTPRSGGFGRGRATPSSPGQKVMSTLSGMLGGGAVNRGRRGGRRTSATRGGGIAGLASNFLGRRR